MPKAKAISVIETLETLSYFEGRTPETTDPEMGNAFAMLTKYRDGEVYLGHYSGYSEWERHISGDEIVSVLDGKTTLIMLTADGEEEYHLSQGGLIIVPKNIWHRFESPDGVKVLTVTPQPTEHQVTRPERPKD